MNGVKDFSFTVIAPEPDANIGTQVAEQLEKFSASLMLLETNGYINQDVVEATLTNLFGQLGVNISEMDEDSGGRQLESMYDKARKKK